MSPRHATTILIVASLLILNAFSRAEDSPPATHLESAAADRPAARKLATRIPGTTITIDAVALPAGEYPIACAESSKGDRPSAAPAEDSKGEKQDDKTEGANSATTTAAATAKLPPLWFATTEITWDAYDAFVYETDSPLPAPASGADAIARPSKPYISYDRGWGHDGNPAICISAQGADAFAVWLSAKSGRLWRLPTPEEWEIACRAGASPPAADQPEAAAEELASLAWTKANSERRTHPVATRKPNAWGLHDMIGNAAEWTKDTSGAFHLAGGSHKDDAIGNRADRLRAPNAAWNASDPQMPKSQWWLADGEFAGFRVVSELNSSELEATPQPATRESK